MSSPSRDETVAFDPAALRNGALSEPPVGKYKEVHVSEPDQYGSEVEPLLLEYAEMVYPRWSEAIRPKDYLNGNPWQTVDDLRHSKVLQLLESDPLLMKLHPTPASDGRGRSGWCLTNSGGGDFEDGDFVSQSLQTAWDDAWLTDGDVTLDGFLASVSRGHNALLAGLRGEVITVKVRAGIGGVALPSEMSEISLGHGRVFNLGEKGQHWLSTRSSKFFDGSNSQQIRLVFESAIETTLGIVASPLPSEDDTPHVAQTVDPEPWLRRERLWALYRFTLALVSKFPVEEAWTHIIYPVNAPSHGMRQKSHHTPRELDLQQALDWQRLSEMAAAMPTNHIGVTVDRLPLLIDGSTHPFDQLLNSVIVWENLFGSTVDTSLRVPACIAWVLERDPDSRLKHFQALKKTYGLRSRVVHGDVSVPPDRFAEVFDTTDVTLRVVRTLLEEFPSLLDEKTSTDRSNALLLKGDGCLSAGTP